MTTHLATRPLTAITFAVFVAACAGTETPTNPTDTGGSSPGTGGTIGGTTSAGGGTSGGSATGGVSTGGNPNGGASTGGVSTGGNPNGGASTGGVSTGGNPNGGASTGGVSTGGNASGGVSTGGKASGGNATGGVSTGGKATGGSSTGGSSTGGSGGASQGCGAATWPAPCTTSGTACSLDVSGTARTYFVVLPTNYSSSQQYPLVFQFHPRGGTAQQAMSYPNIRSSFPGAIYVAPQGLSSGGSTGWPNTNGQDIAFTKAMLNTIQTNYCVDKARIFSTGFSYGGMMSFAVGCEMSDVFRAIAPMSGALYSDFNCQGTGPAIAMWGSHGLTDDVVPIADGRTARDKILQQNHCGTQTTATTPSPCVSYQGCDSGYPTTWCEFDGGHAAPSFAASAIATFFQQF